MNTIAHSAFASLARLAGKAKELLLRTMRAVMEARKRRIQYEQQFHCSFDAYREGKDIPALNGDLRSGS
jgi:hypothetical protein